MTDLPTVEISHSLTSTPQPLPTNCVCEMDPAKIDWKNINSVFVVDDVYEHINAPKWVDFSAPDQSLDDESWFCKPDCNHPKTVEDFLVATPPKLQRSASVSEILPLCDRNRRDANLKRRGLAQASALSNKDLKCDKFVEDGENQNPNFHTTPSHHYNIMKGVIKSSSEKRQIDTPTRKEETPRLKSTLSARNLFGGRDLLNQITEFCNELKRLAARVKERENVEKSDVKQRPVTVKQPKTKECRGENLGEMDKKEEEERKPLLEVSKEKCDALERSNVKEKPRRKKRADEVESIQISLDLNNVKRKERENMLQIRTCPPSPQCFSANRGPSKASTPLKASRTRPQERGVLLELEQSNTELRKEESADNNTPGRRGAAVVAEKEARTLDIFWFLTPCTLSLSS